MLPAFRRTHITWMILTSRLVFSDRHFSCNERVLREAKEKQDQLPKTVLENEDVNKGRAKGKRDGEAFRLTPVDTSRGKAAELLESGVTIIGRDSMFDNTKPNKRSIGIPSDEVNVSRNAAELTVVTANFSVSLRNLASGMVLPPLPPFTASFNPAIGPHGPPVCIMRSEVQTSGAPRRRADPGRG